ncbi:esterase family protein [Paenibacillus doosanensis]|uniref:alpha/beta hydrolase n=1 Tax=Paenibacillus doosanensis TaxID=1229154 RepID=UPI00217FE04C|nr:alpha/beta hydrolase family protein [Paenibacillus doosanensis]MCS7464475.1 esterase family protein [Paenibacillus doosanensis]
MAWLHVHYHSEVLRMPVPMEVLLPQHLSGGSRTVSDPGPYPTLYLLHGRSDDHTAWMRRTSIERYVERLPLAVVMPAGHLGWYTDMAMGRNYFTFITEELPAVCERMFPLSGAREDRFIAGLSMGGYGAMKAGLLVPEKYAAAASFSGALDALDMLERIGEGQASDVFGSKEQLAGSKNDLFAAAAARAESDAPCPELYAWCGTEDFLYEASVRFRDHALQLGLPLTYEEGPGDHSWAYWDRCIERVLQWLPLRETGTR